MQKPKDRYCKRLFRGMMDPREMYDPDSDENRGLSDDADNFKYDPTRTEDVKILNFAFLDRVSRIWQNRVEYFHDNEELIDLYDCFSNLAFQFHMVELYKPSLMDKLGKEKYKKMEIDEKINLVKMLYTDIIACSKPDNANMIDDMISIKDGLDEASITMREFGRTIGMPF